MRSLRISEAASVPDGPPCGGDRLDSCVVSRRPCHEKGLGRAAVSRVAYKEQSDPTDAKMAARSVFAGVADATPKPREGEPQTIRKLKRAPKPSHQNKAMIVTAPAQLRETLHGLTTVVLVAPCSSSQSGRTVRTQGTDQGSPLLPAPPLPSTQ